MLIKAGGKYVNEDLIGTVEERWISDPKEKGYLASLRGHAVTTVYLKDGTVWLRAKGSARELIPDALSTVIPTTSGFYVLSGHAVGYVPEAGENNVEVERADIIGWRVWARGLEEPPIPITAEGDIKIDDYDGSGYAAVIINPEGLIVASGNPRRSGTAEDFRREFEGKSRRC